jgi:hypothetical protein
MDELEAEIAQILDEKTHVLAAVRQYMEESRRLSILLYKRSSIPA